MLYFEFDTQISSSFQTHFYYDSNTEPNLEDKGLKGKVQSKS